MAVTLTTAQVETLTGTTVSDDDISIAAALIDDETGWTVDEHSTTRLIAVARIRAAWAVAAVHVHNRLEQAAQGAVTSETQGDYSYTESDRLATMSRFGQVCDGTVLELLGIARASWHHV